MAACQILPLCIPPNATYSWCDTDIKETTIYYMWNIKKFACLLKRSGEPIKSSVFSATEEEESKWFLQLYPKGLKEENGDQYVSLFLHHIQKDKDHEVTAEVEFSIIKDRKEKTYNQKSTQAHKFTFQSFRFGFPDFIARDAVVNPDNNLLHNGELKILCEIRVATPFNINGRYIGSPLHSKDSMPHLMAQLLENQTLCDVTLVAQGKEVHAHKAILAAKSAVFAATFQNGTPASPNMNYTPSPTVQQKSRLVLTDVDHKTLEEMIRFMYIGQAPIMDEKLAANLLVSAEKFKLEELKEICEQALSVTLTAEKVVDLIPFATLHNANYLKAQLVNFLKSCAAYK